jgi:8-oxo-dGTP diphosphatase
MIFEPESPKIDYNFLMNDVPRVGIGVFIWRNGKFLMQRRIGAHGAGTWSIPGGKLDFGESLEECGAREVYEETGVRIKNVRFLAVTNDIFKLESKHFVTIWLESDWAENEPEIKEPNKLAALGWHTFKDLPDPLFEPCWQNLRKLKPELFV